MTAYVLDNQGLLPTGDFVDQLEKEANSGDIGVLKYARRERGLINGRDAITLKEVFAYDSYIERTYIADGSRTLVFDFTSRELPPRENQETLNSMARDIIRSAQLLDLTRGPATR